MKFLSGSRNRSVTYVVRPAIPKRDAMGRQIGTTTPLRAEFREHHFNSESAQQRYRWTDEERQAVEKYLMDHGDWGRGDGRGIFLDRAATVVSERELLGELKARGAPIPERRCLYMQDVGDETVQCDQMLPADEETDFCELHLPMVLAATEQD